MKLMKTADFFKAQEAALVEPTKRDVEKMRRALDSIVTEAQEPLQRMRRELLAGIPQVDAEMPMTADEQDRVARLLEDVARVDDGNWGLGISDRRLEPFVGMPGLNVVNLWVAKYQALLAEESSRREMTWPHDFRYSGRPGAMVFEGRRLRRGDVVSLSRSQYEAWKDRFTTLDSEVSEEQPEAVTS